MSTYCLIPRRTRRLRVHQRCLILCLALFALSGCTRSQYRIQANEEAYAAIAEKTNHPHWALPNYAIDVGPRSRMFSPFHPDHPPMPPDDPASHKLMHYIDGKKHYPHWHQDGDTPYVENPSWMEHLRVQEMEEGQPVVVIDTGYAIELAYVHSDDYQSQLETLYLSALDVTAERFRFDCQFFGGYATDYTVSQVEGRVAGIPFSESSSVLEAGTFSRGPRDWGFTRQFSTGANLVVGFANRFMWDFAGADTHQSFSMFDFAFVQPLLRNAGRDRVLETLTIAERALLANVRQMERYRRGFVVEVVTGRNAGPGPSRRGGFFGASGLGGFTGVGAGGFGGVGGGGGGFAAGGTGAAGAGGILGLLQTQQEIANQRDNLIELRRNLVRLEAFLRETIAAGPLPTELEGGGDLYEERVERERLQIAQARQAVLNAESRLINSTNGYQQQLDDYKQDLGLPPHLCVVIRDPVLEDFANLIDPRIKGRRDELEELILASAAANESVLEMAAPQNGRDRQLAWDEELQRLVLAVQSQAAAGKETLERIATVNLPAAYQDLADLRQAIPKRVKELRRLERQYERSEDEICALLPLSDIDPALFDASRLDALPPSLESDLNSRQEDVRALAARFDQLLERLEAILQTFQNANDQGQAPDPEEVFDELVFDIEAGSPGLVLAVQEALVQIRDVVASIQVLQARARTEVIELPAVQLTDSEALQIASKYRRDWMNARAALVDSWRLIRFNADQLESNLDVVFDGDIAWTEDTSVPERIEAKSLRVGLQFDAPLNRLQERNTYRQALIDYHRARRDYYQFVDAVSATLRSNLRTLEANALNFENRRFALGVAADQIRHNDRILEIRRQRPGAGAGDTAARDSVSALSDLLNAQNDFLGVFVNYEVLRMSLDFDLGTMRLLPNGRWLDPGPIGGEFGIPAPDCIWDEAPLPLEVLEEGEMHPLPPEFEVEPPPFDLDEEIEPPTLTESDLKHSTLADMLQASSSWPGAAKLPSVVEQSTTMEQWAIDRLQESKRSELHFVNRDVAEQVSQPVQQAEYTARASAAGQVAPAKGEFPILPERPNIRQLDALPADER